MAHECGYSLYHFIRLFNQLVHHTPYDYLIRRRLAQAAEELLISSQRLIDIAVDYRFQTAESFTRAFKRVYHILPSQARRTGALDERLMLQPRTARHLIHFQEQISLQPKRMLSPDRFMAGLPLNTTLAEELVLELAGKLKVHRSKERVWYWIETAHEPAAESVPELVAGSSQVDGDGPSYQNFFGYEITDCSALPPGLFARRLPACQFSAFTHSGKIEDIDLTREYAYQTWLANSDERIGLPLEMDVIHIEDAHIDIVVCVPISREEDENSG
jgi:AraC family transcriptional regulator